MPHIGNFPGPGYPRPLTIGPDAFVPRSDTQDWACSVRELRNRTVLTAQYFQANVVLPQGAVITKLTLYGTRQAEADVLELYLQRSDHIGEELTLASIVADWTGGMGSKETTAIDGMPIDNVNKNYGLMVTIDPDVAVMFATFTCAVIEWR